jgi:hypothetical protein
MAWDPSGRRLLLFGGEGTAAPGHPAVLRDTWAWDGRGWARLRPRVSPPGRLGAGTSALAADAATGEVLMVTDGAAGGTPCSLATWRWSAGRWVELRPATAPRSAIAGRLAYAPGSGGLVLVTALPTASACGGVAADAALWTWDGTSWTEQHPVTALAAKRLVDGQLSSSPAGVVVPGFHTFTWDGGDWHDAGPDPSGPGARFGAAVTGDGRHAQSLLFGGCCIVGGVAEAVYGDTWTWDGGVWTRRDGLPGAPAATPVSGWARPLLQLGSVDAMAVDADALYAIVERLQLGIPDPARALVVRFDRATGAVTTAGPFPGAESLTLAGGRLWAAAGIHPGVPTPGRGALDELDPATLRLERELSLPPPPDSPDVPARLAGTPARLWLGYGPDLYSLDPRDGATLLRLPQGARGTVDDLALDPAGGRLYVSTRLASGDALITERDAGTGARRAEATEHSTAGAHLAATGDGVWITFPTGLSSALSNRRAADLAAVVGPQPAGTDGGPSGDTLRPFVAGGLLWLADGQRAMLSCADPRSGTVRASARIAGADSLAGDADGLYLAAADGVELLTPDPRCAG